MKKRIFSILLCICMVCTLLPTAALAEDTTYKVTIGDAELWTDTTTAPSGFTTMYYKNDGNVGTENDYNAMLEYGSETGFVLTLNGLNVTVSTNESGIYANVPITIQTTGENTVSGPKYGVYTTGALTITGEGKLTATGGNDVDHSYGIIANGGVTVDGGTVIAIGGTATTTSYGIYGKTTVNGGSLTATGGTAGSMSNGLRGATTVNNGSLTASGGTVTGDSGKSYGIYYDPNNGELKFAGGTVNAKGGACTGDESESCGIKTLSDVLVTGGDAEFQGGNATTKSFGIDCKDLRVTGGTAELQGGNAELQGGNAVTKSFGAVCYSALITGCTATFEGGTASESYGLYTRYCKPSDSTSGLGAGSYKGGTAAIHADKVWNDGGTSVASLLKPGFAYYKGEEKLTIDESDFDVGDAGETITVEGLPVTLTFDVDGGTLNGNSSQDARPGKTYGTLPEASKTGYTFRGWYTEANGGGSKVESSTIVAATENHTLYAKWEANTYTVTLNTNGGSIIDGNVTGYTFGTGATLPTEVTKASYTFGGWYDNEGCTGGAVMTIANDATGAKAYWAKWNPIPAENPSVSPVAETLQLTYGYAAGSSISVTATADAGTAYTLSYQWYSCDANGGSSAIVSGATSDSYAVPAGKNAGSYYYYCAVTATRIDNDAAKTVNSGVITVAIAPKPIAITGATATGRSYVQDNASVDIDGVTFDNAVLTKGTDYTVTGVMSDANAGDGKAVTVTVVLTNSNYSLASATTTTTVDIAKASAQTLSDITDSFKYTTTSGEKTIGTAGMPADAGALEYAKGTESTTGSVTVSEWAVDSSGKVTYTLSGGAENDTITLPITIKSTNYADSVVNVKFTLTAKDGQAALNITGGNTVEYGKTLTLSTTGGSGTGAVTYAVSNVSGEATIDGNVLTANKVGTVTVTATKAEDDNYSEASSASVTITITKATPTGTPAYTAITADGKTLADAALNVGSIAPADGTIAWDLGDEQSVAANTAYAWTYTPADTANYNNLTGSITPYVVTSSGSGDDSYDYDYDYTPPSYKVEDVTPDKADGSISSDHTTAQKGDDVTITVTPDRYYNVDGVIVKDKNGKEIPVTMNPDGTFSFEMPAGEVTVEPIFVWDNPFVDVDEETEYAEPVEWALKNGITTGATDTTFAPNGDCTRAQIVTFLWRAAGSPEPTGTAQSFADVDADDYFAKAVLWALENGITTGVTDTTFAPDAVCTRAQTVTFLHRAAGKPAAEQGSAFDDVTADSYYAQAVAWAEANGITKGIGGSLFGSLDECTRIQIVTFLYRFLGELTD